MISWYLALQGLNIKEFHAHIQCLKHTTHNYIHTFTHIHNSDACILAMQRSPYIHMYTKTHVLQVPKVSIRESCRQLIWSTGKIFTFLPAGETKEVHQWLTDGQCDRYVHEFVWCRFLLRACVYIYIYIYM